MTIPWFNIHVLLRSVLNQAQDDRIALEQSIVLLALRKQQSQYEKGSNEHSRTGAKNDASPG
jgi:hypothetical protein